MPAVPWLAPASHPRPGHDVLLPSLGGGAFSFQAETALDLILSFVQKLAGTGVVTTHIDWKLAVLVFCLLWGQEFVLCF